MKVAIDFRSVPFTGIWNYSNHLRQGLQEQGVEVFPVELPPELTLASRLAYTQGLRRLAWENLSMPSQLRRQEAALFHCTNNYGIPYFLSCPSVLTLHDFVPLTLPDLYLPQFRKRLAYQTFLSHSIRAATRIICISEYTRSELLRLFPGVAGKTRRVYHGCSSQYRRLTESGPMDVTMMKYSLPEEFVLTMGGTEPRKNVVQLVEVFRRRWENGEKTPLLAIVGEEWRGVRASSWRLTPNIAFLGPVESAELLHLYNRCKLFVFPSLLEGFGFPVLEAMACGAPVLAMRATSIPEVTGDAAVLADPAVPGDLEAKLGLLLLDASLRSELSARGQARAGEFTWRRAAEETHAVYREAVTEARI